MGKRFVVVLAVLSSLYSQPSEGCSRWIAWLGFSQSSPSVTPESSRLSQDVDSLLAARELSCDARKAAIHDYSAPRKKTLPERSIVIADWAMATLLALRTLHGVYQHPEALQSALLFAPVVLFCSDFVTDVFHKWLDSYASEKNPLWGDAAREFRKHHEFPNNLNHVDYLSHVAAFGKLLAPFFVVSTVVPLDPEYGSSLWLFLVTMLNATEFHKQAHLPKPNLFFKTLQTLRLAISGEFHRKHHRFPLNQNYAVLNGWSTPMTESIDLWRRLDLIFWKFTKKMPHNWIQSPESIPKEIMAELNEDISKIPDNLWKYAELYPSRVPTELKESLEKARALSLSGPRENRGE